MDLQRYLEEQKKELAERLHAKREELREAGRWVGGPLPLGYDCWRGMLQPNPIESEVVKTVFKLVKEMTVQEAFEKTKEMELTNKKGKPVARSSLYRMFEPLRVDIYLGNKYETPILKEEDVPEAIMEKYLKWKETSHQ
ncbi:hypothetical protein NDK43_25905 [Neobacillus pocheonensis]|uniref:Uncharacterized protein n=1 Tax=Neobacillus pocheonensis TaxID=363869 RepID=A0ABT0WI38_9BACI|nr:hypothetical protein [Neobacillus pocheonensis]